MDNRIYIFDTTLRDGEQSPGCSMVTARIIVSQGMARSLHDWQFAHTFDEDRRSFLERLRSFDEIAQELQSQVLITSYRGEKGTLGSVKGCLRPNFKIETSSKAFDEFFNGRSGYRAAYYVDPEEGVRTNESFLSRLVESLVAYALSHPAGQYIDEGTLRRSLALPSAKVWLDEDGFSFDHDRSHRETFRQFVQDHGGEDNEPELVRKNESGGNGNTIEKRMRR